MYGQQLTNIEFHGDSERFIFFANMQWGTIRVVSMMSATNRNKMFRNLYPRKVSLILFFTKGIAEVSKFAVDRAEGV